MKTENKVRPILFATEMVQSLMRGNKRQTRRVIKESFNGCWTGGPHPCPNEPVVAYPGEVYSMEGEPDVTVECDKVYAIFHCSTLDAVAYCPYGKPGDILYVRETWSETVNIERIPGFPWRPHIITDNGSSGSYQKAYIYAADGYFQWLDEDGAMTEKSYWKPSIHMPKKAARIWLRITNIRVERLQDISEEDAKAEGVPERLLVEGTTDGSYWSYGFNCLWNEINGLESWNINPWVWVIEFEPLTQEEIEPIKQLKP